MKGLQVLDKLDKLDNLTEFVEIMADPERKGMTVEKIAEMYHVVPATVYNRANSPQIAQMITDRRAELMRIELPKVDEAMLKAAQNGSVKAAQLVYERWDGYKPRANKVDVNINQAQKFQITQADGTK